MKRLLLILLVLLASTSVHALIITGPDNIAAPGSIIDDPPGATNKHQQGFNEAQDVLLTSDLNVDGGFISSGTLVDSHMIFLNTIGNTFATDTQKWSFDGLILGVMSDYKGLLEVASSSILGAGGTTYPNSGFPARGMEGNDSYIVNGDTIKVHMSVTEPGDWIRVVTASVPEPTTFLIMLLGLLGLGKAIKR